jgi:hypothetical protein
MEQYFFCSTDVSKDTKSSIRIEIIIILCKMGQIQFYSSGSEFIKALYVAVQNLYNP